MTYESPVLEVTNFDVRALGASEGDGGGICGVDTPFIPFPPMM